MSVIAYDGSMIVADMQMGSQYRNVHSKVRKVTVGKTTYYIGFVGDAANTEELVAWFLHNEKLLAQNLPLVLHPWHHETNINVYDGELIVVTVVGGSVENVRCFDHTSLGLTYHVANRSLAWGSGARFAYGAFSCERNAIGAVKVAILNDPHCGLGYEGYDLKTGEHFVVSATIHFNEPKAESDGA